MILALNVKNYDHKRAYGLDNIIIDANYDQLKRGKIDIRNVGSMVRFCYTKNKSVLIEKFDNVTVKEGITTKDYSYKDHSPGVLFIGHSSSSEIVSKTEAANSYPKVFNKLGHFNQFTCISSA